MSNNYYKINKRLMFIFAHIKIKFSQLQAENKYINMKAKT